MIAVKVNNHQLPHIHICKRPSHDVRRPFVLKNVEYWDIIKKKSLEGYYVKEKVYSIISTNCFWVFYIQWIKSVQNK